MNFGSGPVEAGACGDRDDNGKAIAAQTATMTVTLNAHMSCTPFLSHRRGVSRRLDEGEMLYGFANCTNSFRRGCLSNLRVNASKLSAGECWPRYTLAVTLPEVFDVHAARCVARCGNGGGSEPRVEARYRIGERF